MRQIVIEKIADEMKKNENVFFLTGDLGYGVLEKLQIEFPDRFINCGIAEQNLIGVAAGLALSGKKVFIYSIIPFITMRCFEQIRNDICYHNLDITILGVGSGLSYGVLGPTHFALEDISLMRVLPNMKIFNPADAIDAELCIKYVIENSGPFYFRIGKKTEKIIFEEKYHFHFGKGIELKKGSDIVIFTTGTTLFNVLESEKILRQEHNLATSVIYFNTLKPIDAQLIIERSIQKKAIFVVEENYLTGGLTSAVSEVLAGHGKSAKVVSISVKNEFIKEIGSQDYLREKLGLSVNKIVEKVLYSI